MESLRLHIRTICSYIGKIWAQRTFIDIQSEISHIVYYCFHCTFYLTFLISIFYSSKKYSPLLMRKSFIHDTCKQITNMKHSCRTRSHPHYRLIMSSRRIFRLKISNSFCHIRKQKICKFLIRHTIHKNSDKLLNHSSSYCFKSTIKLLALPN